MGDKQALKDGKSHWITDNYKKMTVSTTATQKPIAGEKVDLNTPKKEVRHN